MPEMRDVSYLVSRKKNKNKNYQQELLKAYEKVT